MLIFTFFNLMNFDFHAKFKLLL